MKIIVENNGEKAQVINKNDFGLEIMYIEGRHKGWMDWIPASVPLKIIEKTE